MASPVCFHTKKSRQFRFNTESSTCYNATSVYVRVHDCDPLFFFFPAVRVPTSLTVSLEVASLSQPQSQESCYATVADTVNPSWRSDLIICKGTLESNSYFVRVPYERKIWGGEKGCKGREQASWTPAYTTTKKFDLPLRWKHLALLPNMSWQLDNQIKIVILQETVKSGRDEVLTIRKF